MHYFFLVSWYKSRNIVPAIINTNEIPSKKPRKKSFKIFLFIAVVEANLISNPKGRKKDNDFLFT